jgi:ABC-type oligopeptide transport system ATPase subunit
MIEVEGLTRHFFSGRLGKERVEAVDEVSFNIKRGETLGLVGGSGCGKTTLGRLLLRLIEPTSGRIIFDGVDILRLKRREMRRLRPRMQMIFQDPDTSLNPRMASLESISEPLKLKGGLTRAEIEDEVSRLMEKVGLSPEHLGRRPHQLSGGQNQRVVLARVLASNPEFIVADEPLSALDVSVQAQIFGLLSEMKRDRNITFLFISHDLNIVRLMSDRVAVMDRGKIVEVGPTEEIFRHPLHPRTRELVSSASMDGQLTLMLKEGLISTVTRRPRPRMGGVCDDNPMDSKSSRLMINAGCR